MLGGLCPCTAPSGKIFCTRGEYFVLFLVSHFNVLFVPCGGLSWLPVSFLLHVKYTLSYRIVSYLLCLMAFLISTF